MRHIIVLILALFGCGLAAEPITSDCTPAEQKVMATPEFAALFERTGRLVAKDCTVTKGPAPDTEMLLVAVVGNSATGYESFLGLFDRKTFSAAAKPVFKSPIMGFDMFPMLVNQKYRLLFVHPSSDKNRLVFYVNAQTGPSSSRFSRWEYVFETKAFSEIAKIWMIEAGTLPKIYDDNGTHRALLGARSVEI